MAGSHSAVALAPMNQDEFDRYLQLSLQDYAEASVRAGDCVLENAVRYAREAYDRLLPHGLASANHFFFSIRVDGVPPPIGMLWLGAQNGATPRRAYIYDLRVDGKYRRRGYATGALIAAEEFARSWGADRMSLNVMGWNESARAVYSKAGFVVSAIRMTKTIPPMS